MDKACGRCGRPFGCTQTYGCWCGEIKLDDAQRAWLQARYDNCVCPECLKALAAGMLKTEAAP